MGDLRLLVPAVAAWTTGWLVVGAPDVGLDAGAVAATIWSVGAVVLVLLLVRRRPRGRVLRLAGPLVLVALAASGLVAATAATALAQRAASPLVEAAAQHRTVEVVIEVVSAPRAMRGPAWAEASDDPTMRLDARLVAVDGGAVAPVPVTTSVQVAAEHLQLGARLGFDARVSPLPAAEESAFRLRAGGDVRVVDAAPPWLSWAGGLRQGFAEAARGLTGDGAALVPGLAIGDTGAVDEALDAAMKASSLSHLTAVSGANCAIVTAAAFLLAGLCRVRRTGRIVIAVLALAGFIVLVTPQPSVIRAGTMAVVVLVALAAGRPGGGVTALSVAVIALLTFDPWLARDYGFALSAAATGGLLLLTAPLAAGLARVMPAPLAAVLAVPLAAQLACQPILVLLDPAIALYGVPANLLAAPAAPVGTVVGLVGCLVLPVLPSVGMALLEVAWLPASWIALVAHGAAGLPGGRLPWPADAPGALLLVACTALALRLALAPPAAAWLRVTVAGLLVAATAVPLGAAAGGPLIGAATRPRDWDVAACDIGQGDAVLVRSAGATALIDTGPEPESLDRCLAMLGIERVDLLVLTHWDNDHVGGAGAVAGRVDTVIHGPLDGDRSDRVLGPLAQGGAELIEVIAGHAGELGDARWRVVWPKPRAIPGNDASVVVDLDAPGYRGVFLGDLGEDAQLRLLRSIDLGRVDLVKVAHHGSADQSEALYRELGATVGVIGVGADNGYGHPTGRLLDILTATGTTPLRTDRSGTSVLTADGSGGFALWTERGTVGGRP
ncbi:ComEC/Rec2 family competence protein [Agromyces sp. H66]|uniref:ComEC/Rec2 family competence protein n=1 Tax=Agromyces sp. H66 TaxID=2529859 RepID=UPI0010AA2481|nr:ComEC/Rec2 family competence protein [Agromyces sp. H66]